MLNTVLTGYNYIKNTNKSYSIMEKITFVSGALLTILVSYVFISQGLSDIPRDDIR